MAEHEKGCSCDHSHDNEGIDEKIATDVASKSLSDALRISFTILKIIMAVLVVLFIASGVFEVKEEEQALVLHFGKIRGDSGESRVLGSGLHWAWPAPIDEIIKIKVTRQKTIDVDTHWYYRTQAEKDTNDPTKDRPAGADLDPVRDGYCLTRNEVAQGEGADYSLVHSMWTLTYTISDIEKFFSNIYYEAPGPGEDFSDVVADDVNPLLESLVADAVCSTFVEYTLDEVTGYKPGITEKVQKKLQAKLDAISSGIIVESMQPKTIWPRQVDAVFYASKQAAEESGRLINEAKAKAEQQLNKAGGPRAKEVLEKLLSGNLTVQEREELFSQLSGESQSQISEARAYRTKVVESARANAEYLALMLEEYRKNPELVMKKLHQHVLSEVMSKADEKIFVDSEGEVRIMINRDPKIKKPKKKDNSN